MGGSYPVTREMRRVLQEHVGVYSELSEHIAKVGVGLRPKDAEAKLDFETLHGGKLSFTFTFPLDDNSDPEDGRAYLIETMEWDPKTQALKGFERDVNFANGGMWSPQWQRRIDGLYSLPTPDPKDPRLKTLAGDMALARPQELPEEFKAELKRDSSFLSEIVEPLLGIDSAWQLRIGYQAFFSQGASGHRDDLSISFPISREGKPSEPVFWLHVRFRYHPLTGKMLAWEREWTPAADLSRTQAEEVQGLTDFLNGTELAAEMQASNFAWRVREFFPAIDRPLRAIDVYGAEGEAAEILLPLSGASLRGKPSYSPWGERAALQAEREKNRTALNRQAENFLSATRDPALAVSERSLAELDFIFREPDPAFLKRSLGIWLRNNFLEKSFRPQVAYQLINAAPKLFQNEEGAMDFLAMVEGMGSWGRNLEFQINGISSQAIRPGPILLMGGVGLLGPMAKFAATGHLAKFGVLGRGAASAVGIGTEALVLTAWQVAVAEREGQRPPGFGGSFLANGMWLGGLRLAHGTMNLPLVRSLPVPQIAREISAHSLSILAMNQSNRLARSLDLIPEAQFPWGGGFTAETIQYLHTMTGWNLVNRMTGEFFPRATRFWEMEVEKAQIERARQHWLDRRGLNVGQARTDTVAPVGPRDLKFFTRQVPDLVLTRWNFPQQPVYPSASSRGSIFLDQHLFGKSSEWLHIKRDSAGYFQLWDGRTLRSQPAQMLHHALVGWNMLRDTPLEYNGSPLPTKQWVPLRSGDVLAFLGQRVGLNFPGLDPVFTVVAKLAVNLQQFLLQQLSQTKSFEDFLAAWPKPPWPDLAPLWDRIQAVWKGEFPLVSLPHELGIQFYVTQWMARQVGQLKREGFEPRSFQLPSSIGEERRLPQESEFHSGLLWSRLRQAVASAKNLSDLRYAISSSEFLAIEGKSMPDLARQIGGLEHSNRRQLQDLPYAAGIRQRVRDLLERESFERFYGKDASQTLAWIQDSSLARSMEDLIRLKEEIRRKVVSQGTVRGGARVYDEGDVLGLLYDVLERGRPLALLTEAGGIRDLARDYQARAVAVAEKLFSKEMSETLDPFSGEQVRADTPESRFRLALHLLNSHAGWPVRGLPREAEVKRLEELIRFHLGHPISLHYPDLQELLRKHIDGMSAQAVAMLKGATPGEKAMILDTYFGNYRRRDLPQEIAFQVGALMGQAGLYREVAMTYDIQGPQWRSTLSLGDLSFVSAEKGGDFFLMHSHPEEYLAEGGHLMGGFWGPRRYDEGGARTMAFTGGESVNADTRNILFSQGDIRAFAPQAKHYWALGYPQRFGDTPLYEVENRVFKNFVFHPYGASELRFHFSPQGRLEKIVVRYAFQGDKFYRDQGYLNSIAKLQGMEAELGVPFEFEKIPAKQFVENLPFKIFSFLYY